MEDILRGFKGMPNLEVLSSQIPCVVCRLMPNSRSRKHNFGHSEAPNEPKLNGSCLAVRLDNIPVDIPDEF